MSIEKHEYDDRFEIRLNGETVVVKNGPRQWPPDEDVVNELLDVAEKRLDNANIDDPQREAYIDVLNLIRATLGNVQTVDHREVD